MLSAGRARALILERTGLNNIVTCIVGRAAAVIETGRVTVGQREPNFLGSLRHIAQLEYRVLNPVGKARRTSRNIPQLNVNEKS